MKFPPHKLCKDFTTAHYLIIIHHIHTYQSQLLCSRHTPSQEANSTDTYQSIHKHWFFDSIKFRNKNQELPLSFKFK